MLLSSSFSIKADNETATPKNTKQQIASKEKLWMTAIILPVSSWLGMISSWPMRLRLTKRHNIPTDIASVELLNVVQSISPKTMIRMAPSRRNGMSGKVTWTMNQANEDGRLRAGMAIDNSRFLE